MNLLSSLVAVFDTRYPNIYSSQIFYVCITYLQVKGNLSRVHTAMTMLVKMSKVC